MVRFCFANTPFCRSPIPEFAGKTPESRWSFTIPTVAGSREITTIGGPARAGTARLNSAVEVRAKRMAGAEQAHSSARQKSGNLMMLTGNKSEIKIR
jgi:hypothetical protein